MSYRYNARGSWTPAPVRGSTASLGRAPAALAALTRIDRAFRPAKSWEDMTPGERRDAGEDANARIARALDRWV